MPPPKDPKKREEWLQRQRDSHLGKPSAFKGKKHTEEAKNDNRLAHINKPKSVETKSKMSAAHKGQIPWNAGKKGIYSEERINELKHQMTGNQFAKGTKHIEEWKKWKSESQRGEKNPFYGKEHSHKTKCEISNANLGKVPWIKGKTHDAKTRALIRESRLKQVFPQEDTKPERIMQKALLYRNVEYEKHFPVLGQPDVFIKPNLCVFIDGDATHGNPRYYGINDKIAFGVIAKDRWIKDQSITMKLIKSGYKVLRIWQDDIETDADKCVQFIQYFIQNFLKIQESLPLLS